MVFNLVTLIGKLPPRWIKAVSRLQWRNPFFRRVFGIAAALVRGRDGIIQQGAGKGLRFNAGRANAGFLLGSSEPGVQRALTALVRPGMTVFDVGANVGFLSVIAARLVGETGKVVSFEPLPDNVRQIVYNLSLNGFTHASIRPEALGKTDGMAHFQTSAQPTWGKLASLGSTVSQPTGEIPVSVRRLDSLLSEIPLPTPNLMKIDVEGAEEDVLLGAQEVIRKHQPALMIELHGTNLAIASLLEAWSYTTVVLGSKQGILDAPWDAYVLAAPSEDAQALRVLAALADSEMPRR